MHPISDSTWKTLFNQKNFKNWSLNTASNQDDPVRQLGLARVEQVAGLRVIDLAPQENESLGFDICLGPTGTFIMIAYVDPESAVAGLGMRVGDELVSVNDVSFKMIDVEQAVEVLSTEPALRIVLQTSGFMPEERGAEEEAEKGEAGSSDKIARFCNEWLDPFGRQTACPSFENKASAKRHIRRVCHFFASIICLKK